MGQINLLNLEPFQLEAYNNSEISLGTATQHCGLSQPAATFLQSLFMTPTIRISQKSDVSCPVCAEFMLINCVTTQKT